MVPVKPGKIRPRKIHRILKNLINVLESGTKLGKTGWADPQIWRLQYPIKEYFSKKTPNSNFASLRINTIFQIFLVSLCLAFSLYLPPANEVWGKVICLQVCACPRGGVWSRGVPGGDPPNGYCCGRYASYWNAFLFI